MALDGLPYAIEQDAVEAFAEMEEDGREHAQAMGAAMEYLGRPENATFADYIAKRADGSRDPEMMRTMAYSLLCLVNVQITSIELEGMIDSTKTAPDVEIDRGEGL